MLDGLLYEIRTFRTSYFFFTSNCGSLLINLLGRTLDDDDLAHFSPMVSPPNSLINMLIKKDLIEPVLPSYYAFSTKAQVAQDLIRDTLRQEHPISGSLLPRKMVFGEEEERIIAYEKLRSLTDKGRISKNTAVQVLALAQTAELFYTWGEDGCISYSNKVKDYVRASLRELNTDPQTLTQASLNISKKIEDKATTSEKALIDSGLSYTGLFKFSLGAGQRHSQRNTDEFDNNYGLLGFALYEQDMGDISRFALQRATQVALLKYEVDYEGQRKLAYRTTILSVRKVKSRLGNILPLTSSGQHYGIGFHFFTYEYDLRSPTAFISRPFRGEFFGALLSRNFNRNHWLLHLHFGLHTVHPHDFSQPFSLNSSSSYTYGLETSGQIVLDDATTSALLFRVGFNQYHALRETTSIIPDWGTYGSIELRKHFQLGPLWDMQLALIGETQTTSYNNSSESYKRNQLKLKASFLRW